MGFGLLTRSGVSLFLAGITLSRKVIGHFRPLLHRMVRACRYLSRCVRYREGSQEEPMVEMRKPVASAGPERPVFGPGAA